MQGIRRNLYVEANLSLQTDSSTPFDYAQGRQLCSLGMTYHKMPE